LSSAAAQLHILPLAWKTFRSKPNTIPVDELSLSLVLSLGVYGPNDQMIPLGRKNDA
jgi:hypothetical protein